MTHRPDARILHVIASLHTYGAQRLVAALSAAMPEGFDVRVMTTFSSVNGAADDHLGLKVFDIARDADRRNFSFFGRMVRTMRSWRPAIVHTHMHNGKYWGRLAAITAGVPLIVHTEHNSDFRAAPAVRVLNRALHARTARIVAFSRHHAGRLSSAERIPASKLVVIPNGIVPSQVHLSREEIRRAIGAQPDRAMILHIGRFETVKNQRVAVEAFAASAELRRRAQLFFAGAGPDEPAIRAHVRELGLDAVVSFLGFRDDIWNLLAAADAVAMTSLNEAMPLVAIEAMMAGVPIASVPWDGSSAFFRDGALAQLANSYAPVDLASALEALFANGKTTAERSQSAKEAALHEYSLDLCAQRHASLYRELIASRSC